MLIVESVKLDRSHAPYELGGKRWKENELVHNLPPSSFAKAPADKKDRPKHVERVTHEDYQDWFASFDQGAG